MHDKQPMSGVHHELHHQYQGYLKEAAETWKRRSRARGLSATLLSLAWILYFAVHILIPTVY